METYKFTFHFNGGTTFSTEIKFPGETAKTPQELMDLMRTTKFSTLGRHCIHMDNVTLIEYQEIK